MLHSLSSVIEERRRQGAKGQTMGKLSLAGSLSDLIGGAANGLGQAT